MLISPYLFNVYMYELNLRLCEWKVGWHKAGQATNNLVYADDLTILSPTGRAVNVLFKVCEIYIAKSVCMLITPRDEHKFVRPNIYLSGEMLEIVDKYKKLGHLVTSKRCPEEDNPRK